MPTSKKTISSYNAVADSWAKRLRNSQNLAHEYLEKPAMYAKLPDLRDKSVLCIGCGSGEECDHLSGQGVSRVVGIDIAEKLVDLAAKSYPELEFRVMDMEHLNFPDVSFDFVYSSLTMHYVQDWSEPLNEIYRVLKPGGTLLFSTHHPLRWGAVVRKLGEKDEIVMGYEKLENGSGKAYGDYLTERKISDTWFGELPVEFYHRPLSAIMKDILQSGFQIRDFLEPTPLPSVTDVRPSYFDIHSKIPLFIIFELQKPVD